MRVVKLWGRLPRLAGTVLNIYLIAPPNLKRMIMTDNKRGHPLLRELKKISKMPDELWAWMSHLGGPLDICSSSIEHKNPAIKYIRADIFEATDENTNSQLQQLCDSQLQTIDALKKRLQGLSDKYGIDGRTTGLE